MVEILSACLAAMLMLCMAYNLKKYGLRKFAFVEVHPLVLLLRFQDSNPGISKIMAVSTAGLQSSRATFCTPTLTSSVHVSTRSRPCNLASKVVQFTSSPFSKSAPLQSYSHFPSILQLSKSIK